MQFNRVESVFGNKEEDWPKGPSELSTDDLVPAFTRVLVEMLTAHKEKRCPDFGFKKEQLVCVHAGCWLPSRQASRTQDGMHTMCRDAHK